MRSPPSTKWNSFSRSFGRSPGLTRTSSTTSAPTENAPTNEVPHTAGWWSGLWVLAQQMLLMSMTVAGVLPNMAGSDGPFISSFLVFLVLVAVWMGFQLIRVRRARRKAARKTGASDSTGQAL